MSEWPRNQFTTNKSCIAFVKNIQIKKVLTCIAFNTTFYVLHICTFFVKVDTLKLFKSVDCQLRTFCLDQTYMYLVIAQAFND